MSVMHETSEFIDPETAKTLQKQHYALFGHSAVKLCHYTKTSLKNQGVCYKQKFYGIECHRCLQMTPSTVFCDQKCTYCWRPFTKPKAGIEKSFDEPQEIVERALEAQKTLLSGFGSLVKEGKADGKKLEEAKEPRHAAISLSGEPTLYPELSELVKEFHFRRISTFLVSNALHPEKLGEMLEKRAEPTQLYLSIDTGLEAIHKKLNNPSLKDSWKRTGESVSLLEKFPRTTIRTTIVKGINDSHEKELAMLLGNKAGFIEVKGYMHVGYSRKRLGRESMPSFREVKRFAENLSLHSGYEVKDSSEKSNVILLTKPGMKEKEMKIDFGKLFKKAKNQQNH